MQHMEDVAGPPWTHNLTLSRLFDGCKEFSRLFQLWGTAKIMAVWTKITWRMPGAVDNVETLPDCAFTHFLFLHRNCSRYCEIQKASKKEKREEKPRTWRIWVSIPVPPALDSLWNTEGEQKRRVKKETAGHGESGYRSRYLSHAKRALYHVS